MKTITFEPVMDGRKRKMNLKSRVPGYRHTETFHLHFYQRGKKAYIFNTHTEAVTIRKFDYESCTYQEIDYPEIAKFIEIVVVPSALDR